MEDKAKHRALEAYPPKLVTYSDLFGEETLDNNGLKRTVFIEGYHQAEKDNELTWEDVRDILNLYEEVIEMDFCEDIYGEVLKRFNKQRKEK